MDHFADVKAKYERKGDVPWYHGDVVIERELLGGLLDVVGKDGWALAALTSVGDGQLLVVLRNRVGGRGY